jgi:hypothetical protein
LIGRQVPRAVVISQANKGPEHAACSPAPDRARRTELLVIPAVASAADVYEGYSRVGSVTASYGGKYDIKQG